MNERLARSDIWDAASGYRSGSTENTAPFIFLPHSSWPLAGIRANSTELGRVRVQLSNAEANAASIRSALKAGTLDEASSVLRSPLIQRLRERQVTLKSQLSELSTTLLSGHPRVQRLKSQVNTLNSQIESEARKIEASLQREAEVARAREADLIQRRNVLKSEAGRVGKAQVELRALEREADAQRQLLNTYLVRFKEAQSRQNREYLPADAFVFSKAEVPSQPYFPKKKPTLAGVFFGTLMLGSTVTLAASVLSGTAIRQAYLSESDAPALAHKAQPTKQQAESVQKVAAPPMAPVASDLDSRHDFNPQLPPTSENSVSVSVAVKSVSLLGQGRVVVLTPEADCGALTAVVLARSLAAKPANAVLVDVSGSAVSTKTMLGHSNAAGIKDVLSCTANLGEAIHCDRTSGAHIMPCGNTSAEAAAASASQLPMILDALQQTYEFVIIDCGNADIGGLSRVSNASTLTLIDTVNPNNPFIKVLGDM
ncbi:MAG: GumC family protein, partial [Rhizobiaceae bacterium]